MTTSEFIRLIGTSWPPVNWQDVHVGIALSGGADSVALLRSLVQLKSNSKGSGELIAFHVNHHLRGAASDSEQLWCEQFCEKQNVPFYALQGDVTGRAKLEGDGLEAAARQERYALLTQAAEERGVRYLAFAHNRNDQVETILFRLLRGTGLRGLAGMSRTRALTPSLTLIRPLLFCTREEILTYLRELEQSFCTDQSNTDYQFVRNRIRHELLPLLRSQYSENIDQALLRLSEQANEAQLFLEAAASRILSQSRPGGITTIGERNSLHLNLSAFQNQPPVVVRESLRMAWREAGLAEQEMNFDWWCRLANLVLGDASTEVLNLPEGVRAHSTHDELHLEWQHC